MPLPLFQPLPLDRARAPFSHEDCLFEVKWDGFRALLIRFEPETTEVEDVGGLPTHCQADFLSGVTVRN